MDNTDIRFNGGKRKIFRGSSSPVNALKSEDLPTFGKPTIPISIKDLSININ